MVFLNGCPDVPDDSVQAHELLHAFGALPQGAPNWCRASPVDGGPDTGHPCDSPTDVLYPLTDGRPLQQQVLDFNHDDYYAHSGSWPDIQDTVFLHHLNTPEEALGVSVSGRGLVTSDLPGVDCTASCSYAVGPGDGRDAFDDTDLHLAVPALDGRLCRQRRLRARPEQGRRGDRGVRALDRPGQGLDHRPGPRRLRAEVLQAVLGRHPSDPACGRRQGLEVRPVGRRLHRHAAHVHAEDGLCRDRPRELQEEELSQSRSSV